MVIGSIPICVITSFYHNLKSLEFCSLTDQNIPTKNKTDANMTDRGQTTSTSLSSLRRAMLDALEAVKAANRDVRSYSRNVSFSLSTDRQARDIWTPLEEAVSKSEKALDALESAEAAFGEILTERDYIKTFFDTCPRCQNFHRLCNLCTLKEPLNYRVGNPTRQLNPLDNNGNSPI